MSTCYDLQEWKGMRGLPLPRVVEWTIRAAFPKGIDGVESLNGAGGLIVGVRNVLSVTIG
jgi:hypothetical protein